MTHAADAPKFELGATVGTPAALALLLAADVLPVALLARHVRGDWGVICEADARLNEEALRNGACLMSVYEVGAHRVWVITEADRSATTLLLPEEY